MDMGEYMYTIRSCHRLSQWTWHANDAMDTMRDDDCLPACDACCFVEASGVKSMLCGVYIIWDEIRRKLIRVGKACSDTGSFGARMTGHLVLVCVFY